MYVSKREFEKYLGVLLLTLGSLMLMNFVDKPEVQIALMWSIVLYTIIVFKLNIDHPYCWFTVGFTLYSTAYAIIYCMGLAPYGYSSEVIILPTIAMVVSIFAIGSREIEKKTIQADEQFAEVIMRTFLLFLYAILIICVLHFIRSGFSSKGEMKQANDMFYRLGMYIVRYFTLFVMFYLANMMASDKINGIKQAIFYAIPPVMFSAFTGERDSMIRYVAAIFILLFYFERIKKRSLLILIPVAFLGMISTVYLKYFFLSGSINNTLENTNILYQFLTTDFHAAGRNLQYLINNEWTMGSQGFGLLFTELLYPFVPSGVFFSPDNWFNNVVHTGGFKGYAFTLVGTGYIIGGTLGVIAVFIVVGITIRILYKKSRNSIYSLCIYIYMITTIIFAFRSSLNTIFVALVRICGVSYFICKMISKCSIGGKR